LALAGRKPLTFPVRRPHHHHRPPMAAHLLTSTHTPHRRCTSMHRPHRSATGRQSCLTIHDLFIGPGRADTERTGLMRGEATLFMGVAGGITAGDFGLSRPGRSDDRRHKAPSRPDAGANFLNDIPPMLLARADEVIERRREFIAGLGGAAALWPLAAVVRAHGGEG
jgi:hypothetical protein